MVDQIYYEVKYDLFDSVVIHGLSDVPILVYVTSNEKIVTVRGWTKGNSLELTLPVKKRIPLISRPDAPNDLETIKDLAIKSWIDEYKK